MAVSLVSAWRVERVAHDRLRVSVEDARVDVVCRPDPLQLHVASGVRSDPPAVVAGVDADM